MDVKKKALGRPPTGHALTGAQRQALWRSRKAEREAAAEAALVQSSVIDLSAVAIWNRKQ